MCNMRTIITKGKQLGGKPLNQKIFFLLFMTMPVFYLLERLICSVYDSDMYFIIATGREILENGIPYTNPWTIDSGSGIIIQQWLYAVILALVDKAGYVGFSIFVCMEFIIFAVLWMYFFSMRKIKKGLSFFMLILATMPAQAYLFSTRPQLITMILVLASCIAIEKFMWTKQYRWLVLLPVLVCLEMQVHASMWILHFAVLFAYLVPAFYVKLFDKHIRNDAVCTKWKAYAVTGVFMIGALFLNPYGLDGVLYVFKAFKADTFQYINIFELSNTTFLSSQGAVIILCIALLLCAWKFQSLTSTTMNISAGFLLLMMTAVRNNTCCIFVLAFIMRDMAQYINSRSDRIDWKKDMKLYLVPVLFFADFIFVTNFMFSYQEVFSVSGDAKTDLSGIVSEIQKDYDPDMHIFTGFNSGAYFEYQGFQNLYIDARPELYTSEFTGNKNILSDYSQFCVAGYSVDEEPFLSSGSDIKSGTPVSREKMQDWLSSYDFEYIVANTLSEPFLCGYLLNSVDYELLAEASGTDYVLYRKVAVYAE